MGAGTKRCAIVTGAANGIGRATALQLAEDGMAVCLADHDAAGLERVAAAIADKGGDVLSVPTDMLQPDDITAMVAAARERFGRVDGLAAIAGGAGPRHLHQIDAFTDADWDHVIDLNLRGTFLICRAVVPLMRAQSHGRIVTMSSTIARGRTGPVGTAGGRLAYPAAKAGILGFTRQLAKDVGADGITVNAVLPWLTLSEPGSRIRERYEGLEPAARDRILVNAPMQRPAEAEEVAAAIAFLLSERASFISGVELPIDGAYL